MSKSRNGAWPLICSVLAILIIVVVVRDARSRQVPVPSLEHQYCLQIAKQDGNKNPYCPRYETVWQRGLQDPVAYYTLCMMLFTGVLAAVSIGQGFLVYRQVDLARDEFSATHRPKIIVRNFQSGTHKFIDRPEGYAIEPIFIGQNIGDTKATVTEVKCGVWVSQKDAKLPTDLSFPNGETFQCVLVSGARELFPVNTKYIPDEEEVFDVINNHRDLYCLGVLIYVDGGGSQRETGFCRRYVPDEDRWEVVESEYEYAY